MTPLRTAALLTLLLALPAAAQKIAVLPFTGPGAPPVRAQLLKELCEEVECVPQAKVMRAGKPDLKAAAKLEVGLVVSGKVAGAAKKRALTLTGVDARGKRLFEKRFEVDKKGQLSVARLASARELVLSKIPVAPVRSPAVAEPSHPSLGSTASARPAEPEESPDPFARLANERSRPEERPLAQPEPGAALAPERRTQPMVIAEVGPNLFSRSFEYQNLRFSNLRSYDARMIFAPRIRAELYPLAAFMSEPVAGLGLEVDYAFAIGLRTRAEDATTFPTRFDQLDIGARWNLWLADGAVLLCPQVGYRSSGFSVAPAQDGTVLLGLPAVGYQALRVGAALDYPLRALPLTLFARAAYLQLLALGELGQEPYFPDSGGMGLEGALGLGYRLSRQLEVRATFHLTRYSHTYRTEPTSTYAAAGASDQYLGATASVRYAF
jgi:hypothetical protein